MQETQEMMIQSLGWEDPLEKEMATHSGVFAWKILWTEEPGRLQSMGPQRERHDWVTEHIGIKKKKLNKWPLFNTNIIPRING